MWHDACTLRAVHLTIRTPPSLQLAQAAGCIWHAFFRIPGGGPATQTLSPDPLPPGVSTGFRFTRVRARPCATPRQGPACVAWVWVSDPNEDDFCTSWLPHLPPLGRGLLLTSAQPWPLSFQLLGPFALAGHRATSMPSLIQMSSPNGLHPKRALGSVHWAS